MKEKFIIEAEFLGMEKLDELEKKLERISNLINEITAHKGAIISDSKLKIYIEL